MEKQQDSVDWSQKSKALRRSNPGRAHRNLKRLKEDVLSGWESWVRQEVPAAQDQESIIVRDHLTLWLDQLIESLDPDQPERAIDTENRLSQEAGLHRAAIPGYSLQALFKELSLLRNTILMILEDVSPLDLSEREIINDAFDTTMSLAAMEFTDYQQSQLRIALSETERSNRDLQHFAAIAAHDLKAPLATMTGYLDLLREEIEKDPNASLDLLEVVGRNSRRMLVLVDRLLEYSTLRAQLPSFTEVNLTDVANVAIENLKASISARNAVVSHENLPVVYGDVSLLVQVFQNLIANGIKFNHREMPEVWIRCRSTNEYWIIEFRDNGVGFDSNEKHSIFEPHKRLRKAEFEGSGLGLATVRRIVELHKGSIWAESEPGKGAKFIVQVPKLAPSPEGARP